MTSWLGRETCLVTAVITALTLSFPLSATDIYTAQMLTGKAPVEPSTVRIRIEIESYTTAEEVNALVEAMNSGGNPAFLNAFQSKTKGVVRIMDSRGWNLSIHAAQLVAADKGGSKLQCFLMRGAWNPETQIIRSRDPFMVLELNLDEKGKGDGRLYQDAGIDLLPQAGRIVMSRFLSAPKVLTSVRTDKKKS